MADNPFEVVEEDKKADALKGGLTKDDIVQDYAEKHTESNTARRIPEAKWDEGWSEYNGFVDFSDREEWQAKYTLPEFRMAIRVAVWVLKRALIDSDYEFSIEGTNDDSKPYEEKFTQQLKKLLDQQEFIVPFSDCLHGGLIEFNMNMKCFPVPLGEFDDKMHDEQRYKFPFIPISSYDIWPDPTGRKKYEIHRSVIDYADFKKLVKAGVYEDDALKDIEGDFQKEELILKERQRSDQGDAPKPKWRKEVELMEHWGNVDTVEGDRVYENVTYTIANRRHLARKPMENPFGGKRRSPIVSAPIIKKPWSVWNEGYGEQIIELTTLIRDVLNMLVDANQMASTNAFEMDMAYIYDPTDIKTGVYPSKVFKARGKPPGARAFQEISLGRLAPESFQLFTFARGLFQNFTSNEFLSGSPGLTEKTKGEVVLKTQQAMNMMQDIALEIEQRFLEPLLEWLLYLVIEWNPEILGEDVLGVKKEKLRFKFKVRGMSSTLKKSGEANKVMMLLGIAAKMPPEVQAKLNMEELLRIAVRSTGIESKKVILSDQVKSPEPQNMAPPASAAQGQINQNDQKQKEAKIMQMAQMMKGGQGG